LPDQITFPADDVFTQIESTALTFQWEKPQITADKLPLLEYRVYWDAGYLLDGDFVQLDSIYAFNHNFFRAENLIPGQLYRFQVSAVNEIGEGDHSQVISHFA
jgi:hypothetical protein